jgi:hypothetical protein
MHCIVQCSGTTATDRWPERLHNRYTPCVVKCPLSSRRGASSGSGYRVAACILNKKSGTADKGCFSSLGVGRESWQTVIVRKPARSADRRTCRHFLAGPIEMGGELSTNSRITWTEEATWETDVRGKITLKKEDVMVWRGSSWSLKIVQNCFVGLFPSSRWFKKPHRFGS